jgi:phosphoribosylformylglycinamidine synthase subunit PurS
VRIKVFVTPRRGILDPQGRAVEAALANLGFAGVSDVHLGRYVVLALDAPSKAVAEETVRKMCEQLLANPTIEDYRFEVEPE